MGKDNSENFLASDAMALAGVTDQIVYLEEGDLVDIQLGKYWVLDRQHKAVQREVKTVQAHSGAAELGPYRHYMQKEIFEQPRAIADTLEGVEGIVPELFDGAGNHRPGENAHHVFKDIDSVLILACFMTPVCASSSVFLINPAESRPAAGRRSRSPAGRRSASRGRSP